MLPGPSPPGRPEHRTWVSPSLYPQCQPRCLAPGNAAVNIPKTSGWVRSTVVSCYRDLSVSTLSVSSLWLELRPAMVICFKLTTVPPNPRCSLPLTPRLPPAVQPPTHTYTGRGTRTLLPRREVTELEGGLVNFPCLLAPPTPAQNKCVGGYPSWSPGRMASTGSLQTHI